ncbi:MAG: FHA domain-containing protein, partial [Terriglobia bacterium]
MNPLSLQSETVLEVVAPDRSRQHVPLTVSPFLIGRGGADNHLQLGDGRISRRCAAIAIVEHGYRLEDRGNRYGVFVNGEKVS